MSIHRHPLATCVAVLAVLFTAGCAAPLREVGAGAFSGSVRPQDDLYRAVNGEWLAATTIPADKAGYSDVTKLRDESDERVRRILQELAAREPRDAEERQLRDFHAAFLDEAAIDRAGLAPVQPWLQAIDAVRSHQELQALFGRLQGVAPTPLSLFVSQDAKDPRVWRLHVSQSGLGLPDRDYYLQDTPRFEKPRAAYLAYLQTLLAAAGQARPAEAAQAVYALEQRLAQAQWSRVDLRDPVKRYNAFTPAQLPTLSALAWAPMLREAALPDVDKVIVATPSYVSALSGIVAGTPLPVWQAYLQARLLGAHAEVLPRPLREARFAFEDRALMGLQAPKPRWQQAAQAVNGALGFAVGKLWAERHFPPGHKARMQTLVDHLMQAYAQSIDGLAWMSAETKSRARDKLAKYGTKIGYPEVWRDYSALQVVPGDAFGNAVRAGRFEHERRARRIGQAVDRREWFTTPQTVNAFYSGVNNEIVFPAGFLQPPFFDITRDEAYNYGAIGAVIGHEISHGFDDSGSRYDGDGRLQNWWTEADRRAFDALADRLVKQFDAYEPVPGHRINGRLTLGENIADLSGLQIAHKAWRLSLQGREAPVIGGLTGDQRFFIGWAQSWRTKLREERLLQLLTIDTHSPGEYRANGAAVNHDAFHDSFHTRPGDGMHKPAAERIRIW